MSFKFVWFSRLLLFALAAATAPVATGSSSDEPDAERPQLIFATADVWPWGFRGPDDQPDGTLIRFTDRLAAIANLPLTNELRPHRRAIVELASGSVDFAVLFESPENNAIGIPVERLLTVRVIMAGRAGEDTPLSIEAMSGREVAFIRGTYYGEAFARNEQIIKVPVAGLDQALEMLKLGRVDAIVASDQALYQTLSAREIPLSQLRTDVVISEQNAHLYMSRKARYPELLEPVRQAMIQMRETGELDAIFRLPR